MKKIFRYSMVVFVVLSVISCGAQPEADISAPEPDSDSKEIEPAEAGAESVEEPLSIPDKPLSEDGPWLIINSLQGLFALNPDGSGLTKVTESIVESEHSEQITAAQRGGYIAYHTTAGKENDTAIQIVSFPSIEMIADIPLFSYNDEPDMSAVRAIKYWESMAFSPRGTHLAFMGVIDGPSSDLYQYSLQTGETLQLTTGRTQGYQVVWSPDSKYILHTGADGFGSGAGFATKGIWIAEAETADVKTMYTPPPDTAEMILGWVDDETFVVYSWTQPCAGNTIRTFDIVSNQSTIIWSEAFNQIALDPESDTIVLSTWDDGLCDPESGAGIYFLPVFGGDPKRIADYTGPIVEWSSAEGMFIVSGGSFEEWIFGVTTDGQIVDIEWPTGADHPLPALAPETDYVFWTGNAPFIGSIDNFKPMTQFFDESIHKGVWTPDGNALIFLAKSGLYIAHQPEFRAIQISPDIKLQYFDDYLEWLSP